MTRKFDAVNNDVHAMKTDLRFTSHNNDERLGQTQMIQMKMQ